MCSPNETGIRSSRSWYASLKQGISSAWGFIAYDTYLSTEFLTSKQTRSFTRLICSWWISLYHACSERYCSTGTNPLSVWWLDQPDSKEDMGVDAAFIVIWLKWINQINESKNKYLVVIEYQVVGSDGVQRWICPNAFWCSKLSWSSMWIGG